MGKHADQARRVEQMSAIETLLSTRFLRSFHMGTEKLLNDCHVCLGPFEILSKKGVVVFQLQWPAFMSRKFNVFHVFLHEQFKDGCRQSAPPPAVLDGGEVLC